MGFYEDERIRNKNLRYSREGITNNGISLKLNNVSSDEIIKLLVKNGYTVELGHVSAISVDRKNIHGETISADSITTRIEPILICSTGKSPA